MMWPKENGDELRLARDWPRLPDGFNLGAVTGLSVDSSGDVFVFHRAGREWSEPLHSDAILAPTILKFHGRTGALLSSWGQSVFAMPHGLRIDNQDNIWVTDIGLHQVFKFGRDGACLLTVGDRGVPGCDQSHFDRPTDVAVLGDGSFYVTDGYRNSRVAMFSSDGRFQLEWGRHGSAAGEFDVPHGITLGVDGLVYVVDRENERIQIFTGSGQYLTQWKSLALGRPWGIATGPNGKFYVVDGHRPIIRELDREGTVMRTFGRADKSMQFRKGHDIAAGREGSIYVGALAGVRLQKWIPLNSFIAGAGPAESGTYQHVDDFGAREDARLIGPR